MSRTIMLVRTKWMKILKWFMEFLIICGSCRVLLGTVFLIYLFFPNIINGSLFFWFYISVPVALILAGIVNLLQIADTLYMRKGVLNPAIARDSYQDFGRRDRQNRRIGILCGLSGLAVLFGFAPSLLLYPLYLFRSEIVPINGEIVLLLLLVMLYKKILKKKTVTTGETTE